MLETIVVLLSLFATSACLVGSLIQLGAMRRRMNEDDRIAKKVETDRRSVIELLLSASMRDRLRTPKETA